jgi:RHS repeat-associated protein
LEEDQYYPGGLTMAGISDKALKGGYPENKYRYNKGSELQNKEFADGTGLEMYDAHARMYDPQLGRFMQVDPKPDEDNQQFLSTYQFAFNNPELYNDPNGKCPTCIIGAFLGAAIDYGTQVVANRLEGKTWSESLTQVNGGSIFISAVAGAASGGLSAFTPKTAAAKVLVKVAATGIDATESALKQLNESGTVSLTQTLSDVVVNKIGDKLTEHIKVNTNEIKTTERNLDRAARIAAGDPTSSGRAATVKQLEKKLVIQNGEAQAASKVASGVTSNAIQATIDAAGGDSKYTSPRYNSVDNVAVGLRQVYLPTKPKL